MNNTIEIPTKPKRKFVSEDLVIDSWEKIESLFEDLVNRSINNTSDLEKWMMNRSELAAVLKKIWHGGT